jgi:uncharacterized OB-fold protein
MEVTKQMVEKTVTGLRRDDVLGGKVITAAWGPKLEYAWDNGVAIGRYLAELKNGRIVARRCRKCNRVMVPPRMFCELCWRPTDEWVYCGDTGTINTFCISHVDWAAGRLDIEGGQRPFTPAVIEIDGASPGMGILHMIEGVDPWDIEFGMKVQAVWKAPKDRTGAITDILYFKPIGPVGRRGRVAAKGKRKAKAKKAAPKPRAKAARATKPGVKAAPKPRAKARRKVR